MKTELLYLLTGSMLIVTNNNIKLDGLTIVFSSSSGYGETMYIHRVAEVIAEQEQC